MKETKVDNLIINRLTMEQCESASIDNSQLYIITDDITDATDNSSLSLPTTKAVSVSISHKVSRPSDSSADNFVIFDIDGQIKDSGIRLGDPQEGGEAAHYITAGDLKTINGQTLVGYGDIRVTAEDERVDDILELIPEECSSTNQLADKEYVHYVIQDASIKISDLSTNVDNLNDTVTDVSNNLNDISTNVSELNTTVSDISTNLSSLTGLVSDISTNLNGLTTKISDVSNNLNDISTNLNGLNTTVSDISTNLSSLTGLVSDISTNLNGLTTKISDVSNNLNDISTNLNGLNTTVSDISTNVSGLAGLVTDVSNNLNDISTNVSSLNVIVSDISTNLSSLTGLVTDVSTNVSGLNAAVSDISTNLNGLTTKISDVSTNVSGLNAAVSDISTNLSSLTGLVSDVSNNLNDISVNVSGLNTTVSDISINLNGLTTKISDVSNAVTEISTIVSGKQDALVSGSNIKTINNLTLLGSGNILIDTLDSRVDEILALIPTLSSSTNQLADKAFVNSTVQTGTANFRGSWSTWNDVPTASSLYPADYAGSRVPTSNDYLVVQDSSQYLPSLDYIEIKYAAYSSYINYKSRNEAQYTEIDAYSYYPQGLIIGDNVKVRVYCTGPNGTGRHYIYAVLDCYYNGNVYHEGDMILELFPISENTILILQLSAESFSGTWRFKYSGLWETSGRSGWLPEYQINEEPLTAALVAALNSGITALLTAEISNKEDKLPTRINGNYLHVNTEGNLEWSEVSTDSDIHYVDALPAAGIDNNLYVIGCRKESTNTDIVDKTASTVDDKFFKIDSVILEEMPLTHYDASTLCIVLKYDVLESSLPIQLFSASDEMSLEILEECDEGDADAICKWVKAESAMRPISGESIDVRYYKFISSVEIEIISKSVENRTITIATPDLSYSETVYDYELGNLDGIFPYFWGYFCILLCSSTDNYDIKTDATKRYASIEEVTYGVYICEAVDYNGKYIYANNKYIDISTPLSPTVTVIDSLDSSDGTAALSAAQGKTLNETKQSKLPDYVNSKYLHVSTDGQLEWSDLDVSPGIEPDDKSIKKNADSKLEVKISNLSDNILSLKDDGLHAYATAIDNFTIVKDSSSNLSTAIGGGWKSKTGTRHMASSYGTAANTFGIIRKKADTGLTFDYIDFGSLLEESYLTGSNETMGWNLKRLSDGWPSGNSAVQAQMRNIQPYGQFYGINVSKIFDILDDSTYLGISFNPVMAGKVVLFTATDLSSWTDNDLQGNITVEGKYTDREKVSGDWIQTDSTLTTNSSGQLGVKISSITDNRLINKSGLYVADPSLKTLNGESLLGTGDIQISSTDSRVDEILKLIPSSCTSTNKLTDTSYVTDSIQTATANAIETIKLDGSVLSVVDKSVDIILPSTDSFLLKSNITTTLSDESTDELYPSAKAVYDIIIDNEFTTAKGLNTLQKNKADVSTTLAGYGITDAKIENGTIILGDSSIIPLTQHQSLENYVQKVADASLYPNVDASKLETIATGAEVNSIIGIQIDGVDVILSEKKANLITTSNVAATETSFATKGYVDQMKSLEIVAAETLPTADASTMDKIYLIPSSTSKSLNTKIEYITIRSGEEGGYAYDWEMIGSTEVDLSNYVEKETGKGLYPVADASKLSTIETGAQVNAIDTIKFNNTELPIVDKTVNITLTSSGFESVTNKVTSLSEQSTDDLYPTAKLMYDLLLEDEEAIATTFILVQQQIAPLLSQLTALNKMTVMTDLNYHKCDIKGSFINESTQSNTRLTLTDASIANSTDSYLTVEYQMNLTDVPGDVSFKIGSRDDINWFDVTALINALVWNSAYTLTYNNCDTATKAQSYIEEGEDNSIVLKDEAYDNQYYKIVCKIPNNNWSNGIITITKEE